MDGILWRNIVHNVCDFKMKIITGTIIIFRFWDSALL